MQPISIKDFRPRAQITVYTTTGETYDITASCITCELSRSVGGQAGAFAITMTAADNQGNLWQDRITPMSYVEIRMSNGKRLLNGKLPIRMRGFVDSVDYEIAFGPSGGPDRKVIVSGRDYLKLLQMSNVQFIWTESTPSAVISGTLFGLSFNYGLPWNTNTVKSLLSSIITRMFNGEGTYSFPSSQQIITNALNSIPAPTQNETQMQQMQEMAQALQQAGVHGGGGQAFLPAFRKGTGIQLPNIILSCTIPDRFEIISLTVQPFSGPLINLVSYFGQASPIGELFVWDHEDGPVMVSRIFPGKDANGMWISPSRDPSTLPYQLGHIFIDTDTISERSTSLTDSQVLNYFFVWSDTGYVGGGSSAAYVSTSLVSAQNFSVYAGGETQTNPYWISESVERFGLRPLNVDSPLVPIITKDGGYKTNAIELATWCGKCYGHNEKLLSGTITAHGSEDFIPGRYLGLTDKNTGELYSYYIEDVDEVFNFIGAPEVGWSATLGVTRGQRTSSFAPMK